MFKELTDNVTEIKKFLHKLSNVNTIRIEDKYNKTETNTLSNIILILDKYSPNTIITIKYLEYDKYEVEKLIIDNDNLILLDNIYKTKDIKELEQYYSKKMVEIYNNASIIKIHNLLVSTYKDIYTIFHLYRYPYDSEFWLSDFGKATKYFISKILEKIKI